MKHKIVCAILTMMFPLAANATPLLTLPTFTCTLTKKLDVYNWPGSANENFIASTPKIYFICQSDNVRTGDHIRAVWIADHTYGMPPSKILCVKSKHVVTHRNSPEIFEANFSLGRPGKAWPKGSYHIQTYINDIPSYNYNFTIR